MIRAACVLAFLTLRAHAFNNDPGRAEKVDEYRIVGSSVFSFHSVVGQPSWLSFIEHWTPGPVTPGAAFPGASKLLPAHGLCGFSYDAVLLLLGDEAFF